MPPVLVYQIGALGDTIVSIPSYRAIRRFFANDKILLLQAELEPGRVMPSDMLLREHLIDGVMSYPHKPGGSSVNDAFLVWKTVVRTRPKAVVYIGPAERSFKIVKRDKQFFKRCGVRHLYGFHGVDYAAMVKPYKPGDSFRVPSQAEMRLWRLEQDGVKSTPADLAVPLLHPDQREKEDVLDWLMTHRRHPDRKLVTLGFMTAQDATRWPIERFEKLGRQLLADGNVEIVVVGGPGDVETAKALTCAWSDGLVAAGLFDVHRAAALIAMSDLYIGLNTGTTHMAAAVGAKVLAIYSDNNRRGGEWEPMGVGNRLIVNRVPCGGCEQTVCPIEGHPCMEGITVDEVYRTAVEYLGAS